MILMASLRRQWQALDVATLNAPGAAVRVGRDRARRAVCPQQLHGVSRNRGAAVMCAFVWTLPRDDRRPAGRLLIAAALRRRRAA